MAGLRIKRLKDINFSGIKAFANTINSTMTVKVGVPVGAGNEKDGTAIALIAAVHEYGSPARNIPERPFLSNTIRDNKEKYVKLNRINLIKILKRQMTQEQALGQLGLMAQGDVQRFIASNNYVLKPATIARKGSSKALIDTGNLRQSITFEVSSKESE